MAFIDLLSHTTLGVPLSLLIPTLTIIIILLNRFFTRPRIPYINKYPNDWFGTRAKAAFVARGAELVAEGRRKFGEAPVKLVAMFGERVILPEEWLAWVAGNPDLDHQAQVAEVSFRQYCHHSVVGGGD